MNKKFTKLIAAVALLAFMTPAMVGWGQSDYSTTYTSGVTLSTTGGTNASTCNVIVTGSTQYDGIKAGTSSKAGAMQMTVPSGTKYLHIHVVGWKGETVSLSVTPNTNISPSSITLTSDDGISNNSPFTLSTPTNAPTNYYKVITFTNALTSNTDFTFSSGKRFVIWGVNAEEEDTDPTISATPASLTGFTYIEGNGPSAAQTVSVSGSDLTANISLSLGDNSNFEMCLTENGTYTNSLTLTQTNGTVSATNIYVRLKTGLSKAANYEGTITLTSTNATNKTVSLSGSVTGQTYAIEQYSTPATANGTITFDPTSPVESGTEVTLTAEPADGYDFTANSWVFYKESGNDIVVDNSITVTNSKITMPAYDLYVDATFTPKTTYAVTCTYDDTKGLLEANPISAYEGQTVTLSYATEAGFSLSSIVITKTSDSSATSITLTASGNDFTFTMPAYAVTATATFVSNTYEGNFAPFSGSLTEGDYILVYNNQAMNDTINNNKFKVTSVSVSNSIISNPSRAIVWHIAPSKKTGYWTIYSAVTNKYVGGSTNNTNVSLNSDTTAINNWKVSGAYDFQCKANEGQSTARYLRNNNGVYGNYASSNGGALTLYKYTTLTERTITFNGNGGTYNDATTYTQNVYSGIEATLNANQFVRDGYSFTNWSTEVGGGGTPYNDRDTITVNANTTLYAQWAQKFTASVANSITGGTVKIVVGEEQLTSYQAIEGTEITLLAIANPGYSFSAWNVKDSDNVTVTVDNNKFTMPAKNVTISAVFNEAQTYNLVKSVGDIISGGHYYIASGNDGTVKAMTSQNNGHYRNVVSDISVSSEAIVENNDIYEFVIIGPDADGYYTIFDAKYDENNGGYLYASSSSSNNMDTQATNDNNGRWSISINGTTGAAYIEAQGTNTRYKMRFNNDRFSCYGENTSISALPYLYAKHNETPVPYTKEIIGFGDDNTVKNGWYLIASPVGQVTPTAGNNFLANTFDLYAFDQSETEEWRNYKQGAFNLVSGHGYLYANSNTVTLTFEGMPYVGNGQVFLAYEGTAEFPGYNLIGNPYNASATVNKDFYKMNDEGSEISVNVATGGSVAAMEGIFVVATAADQSVTFTPESQDAPAPSNQLVMNLSRSTRGSAIDRAIVRFEETEQLPKFQLFENSTKLYIPQNGKDYAVVRSEAQGEMPVNFKAAQNGSYTLSIDIDADMDYLHLIDNMTGADVDLLQTPSYTFDARTSDYASRFRLVFSANTVDDNTSTGSATFAYFNGSEWVINASDNATVQVVDVMGRVILNSDAKHGVSTANMPAGVYMLRLVNGNNVKVQKIVVR